MYSAKLSSGLKVDNACNNYRTAKNIVSHEAPVAHAISGRWFVELSLGARVGRELMNAAKFTDDIVIHDTAMNGPLL
jgi:hypothetical protein